MLVCRVCATCYMLLCPSLYSHFHCLQEVESRRLSDAAQEARRQTEELKTRCTNYEQSIAQYKQSVDVLESACKDSEQQHDTLMQQQQLIVAEMAEVKLDARS
jgi:hypothetical protein